MHKDGAFRRECPYFLQDRLVIAGDKASALPGDDVIHADHQKDFARLPLQASADAHEHALCGIAAHAPVNNLCSQQIVPVAVFDQAVANH